jgi:histidine ammonia-lyase
MEEMKAKKLVLTGDGLTLTDIYSVAYDSEVLVTVPEAALANIDEVKKFLDRESGAKVIYGVNTGFGPMASHIIGRSELKLLQKNLVRGHAVGMGDPIPQEYVLAAMVVRLNTLAKGYSGVSRELVKRLELFVNKRIIPVVPEHGAVGTSGDLVQLAHVALALIGQGDVFHKGKRERTRDVLRRLKIPPYALQAKEGLSLINGTSMMAGIAALACVEARRLVSLSIQNGAFCLESVGAFSDSISKELHQLRPHRGQVEVAQVLRTLLASSRLLRNRKAFQDEIEVTGDTHTIPEGVQEVYSFRCIPQVLGPVVETLREAWARTEIEVNAATDNPIVDLKGGAFLHGGNFHGDYIAVAMDQLKASLVKLTMLSERRINFFLNRNVNQFFPPFLNLATPGLTMGLQGLQFVATSTTAQNQTLAFPQHVHSIPTNGDNQDIVSMGTDAALLASRVIANAYIVLSIELVALAQAADFLGKKGKLSTSSRKLCVDVRRALPTLTDDRELFRELDKVLRYAKQGRILDMKWQ